MAFYFQVEKKIYKNHVFSKKVWKSVAPFNRQTYVVQHTTFSPLPLICVFSMAVCVSVYKAAPPIDLSTELHRWIATKYVNIQTIFTSVRVFTSFPKLFSRTFQSTKKLLFTYTNRSRDEPILMSRQVWNLAREIKIKSMVARPSWVNYFSD